jgi:hypothetical protein
MSINEKWRTSFYSGVFYRTIMRTRYELDMYYKDSQIYSQTGSSNCEITKPKNRFLNFILGIKENYKLTPRIFPYIAIDLKYYTGNLIIDDQDGVNNAYVVLKTNLSLQFTFGLTLQTIKEVKETGNPLKFE